MSKLPRYFSHLEGGPTIAETFEVGHDRNRREVRLERIDALLDVTQDRYGSLTKEGMLGLFTDILLLMKEDAQ